MKRKQLLAATISIATLALFQLPQAAAVEGAAKVDLVRAKQIVESVCAACHGADGNSVVSVNPNLAGQGGSISPGNCSISSRVCAPMR
jgi:cytochrome c553